MFKALDERIEEEIILGNVSDVCFGVGQDEEVHLFSSRCCLAMASPVFHAMFFGPQWHKEAAAARHSPARKSEHSVGHTNCRWGDKLTGTSPATGSNSPRSREFGQAQQSGFRTGQHHYVAVPDIEPSAFKCMLRYVHHLDPLISLDNALQVYRAADKYQIDGLPAAR
ncbi:Btbd1, partial [Symbiodinium pilosum]